MAHKRLIIDANILLRGVLGQRVRQLMADACGHVAFYVAEANYAEVCPSHSPWTSSHSGACRQPRIAVRSTALPVF